MLRTTLHAVVLLALASAAWAQSAEESKSFDPASWVPADALVYIGVTDMGRTWEDFQKTAAYKVFQEATKDNAKSEFSVPGAILEKLQEQLAKALDVPQSQLKNPLTGPLAFYLNAPAGKTDKPELALIARVGDRELMKQYYESATAKLKKSSKHESERAGSNTIDVFTTEPDSKKKDASADEDEDAWEEDEEDMGLGASPDKLAAQFVDKVFSADSLPEKLALCLTDDLLVVSGSADSVKAILRRDNDKSLADTEDHKAFIRLLKPQGTIHVLFNIPRFIEVAKSEASEEQADHLRDVCKILGTDSMRSIVGHVRFAAGAYDSTSEALFLMNGERSGLAKLLSMENRPVAPPSSISVNTPLYVGLNIEVPKLLDEIERMIRSAAPESADNFRKELESMSVPGAPEPVNGRREFFDHLTGPLTLTLTITKPIAPNCANLLLSLGHKDQSAIAHFFGLMQGMLKARDLRGTQVFDTIMPPGISVAAATDKLYFGNTPGVESALQSDKSDPLVETSVWRRIAKGLPERGWLVLYVDQHQRINTAIALAEARDATPAAGGFDFGGMLLNTFAGLGETPKPAQVAQVRKIVKYATQGAFTIETTSEGLKMTQVTLKPEEE